jgi:hypothetical protein
MVRCVAADVLQLVLEFSIVLRLPEEICDQKEVA